MTKAVKNKAVDRKTAEPVVSLLNGWKNFLSPSASPAERIAEGRALRSSCHRVDHGKWKPSKDRPSIVELLQSQDARRVEHLVPLRYGRMMKSPFAFYRGAALIMACDLGSIPRTDLLVQLCGDCHLSNFGLFATPERNVIFDLNDFDETLPGPFEWDLKRLAASVAVSAIDSGFSDRVVEKCVSAIAQVYRQKMEEFSQMNTLDIWYQRVDWEFLVSRIKRAGRRQSAIDNLEKLKEKRSHAGALAKLTEVVDGKRKIKDNPPLIYHSDIANDEAVRKVLLTYGESLWESRRTLLQRYHLVDVAVKVVGVGSVGTGAALVLLKGEGNDDDHVFLQVKEAGNSVLEPYLGRSQFDHPGNRIVNGQRLMQASSDMFLGWTSGPKRDFYVRQYMDVKASVPVEELDALSLEQYAQVCGLVLARAHARTGDPAIIYGYLGKGDVFDEALVKFAMKYQKQNEQDFTTLTEAINKGRIPAIPGI